MSGERPPYPGHGEGHPAYPGHGQGPPAYPGQGPGYPPYPAPMPPRAADLDPLPYHRLHKAGRPGWWRPTLGIALLILLSLLVIPAILQVGVLIWLYSRGGDVMSEFQRIFDLTDPTPFGLGFLLVVLAFLIPVTFFVTRVVHGLRPGWLTSVAPRMRWRYFAVCLGLSVVALVATVLVSMLLPSQPAGQLTGEVNEFTTELQQFLLLVVLLVPLQAAGEEYAFRGYLTQVFGSFLGRWGAVIVPAVLFALAHGAQSVPVFFDRLAFGLVAGYLVIRTGGLEAGIAMHVLNNMLAFSFAIAFGDMGEALQPSGGTWWSIPVTVTQSLVYLWLATRAANRMGLSLQAEPAVLVASRRRV